MRAWDNPAMQCAYFDRGDCASCPLIPTPYDQQVAGKQDRVRRLIDEGGAGASPEWEQPVTSPQTGFRVKAKLAVGGTWEAPTLGITDRGYRGVDLRECPILADPIRAALPALADLITDLRLQPYDVARRRGELKHLLLTSNSDGDLMIRFVLRSRRLIGTLAAHLDRLHDDVPAARVVSVNIQPVHTAIIEGPDEVPLTEATRLPLQIGDVTLLAGPQAFIQTNSPVARELYATVARWAADCEPDSMWDLYCGVGGFALTCAAHGVRATGVEVSPEAIDCATRAAAANGLDARFHSADATAWAAGRDDLPDLVVVNPPRRGIGPDLARWLEDSGVPDVIYSSCHPDSQRRDLDAMPSYRPVRARLFDMFPHTRHAETAVHLRRG